MIQCRACHYQAIGRDDLASHIESTHGFAWPAAWAEAGRVVGAPDLRQERIDLPMVQDLRARLAAAEGENVRLRAALEEAISEYESIAKDNYEGTKYMIGVRRFLERWRAAREG